MAARPAGVLAQVAAPLHESHLVPEEEARQRVRHAPPADLPLNEGMSAAAGVLDAARPDRDDVHAVAEEAAEVPRTQRSLAPAEPLILAMTGGVLTASMPEPPQWPRRFQRRRNGRHGLRRVLLCGDVAGRVWPFR
jgi:hypothetical protein